LRYTSFVVRVHQAVLEQAAIQSRPGRAADMFIILMGVAGSGKTTIGRLLAERLRCSFYDGDDYHSSANVAKMASGIALDDDDRAAWLASLAEIIRDGLERDENGVMACSALKEAYRNVLCVDPVQVKFFYLKGDYETLLERMWSRGEHYMKPAMLQSQFAALEEPADVPGLDVKLEPAEIVRRIMEHITT
jgi:gluconokinase